MEDNENAILYSKEYTYYQKEIKVSVKREADSILIEVYDNGIGIIHELQPRIFDMFTVATEKPKGFGLGLYIAKKAVEKLSGEITVSSKENEFTLFNIILPHTKR